MNVGFVVKNGVLKKYRGEEKKYYLSNENGEIIYHLSGRDASGLERVVIPAEIREIDGFAFDKSPHLREVILNDGLQTVSSFAFRDCKELKDVYVSDSVRHINAAAFPDSRVTLHARYVAGASHLVWCSRGKALERAIMENAHPGVLVAMELARNGQVDLVLTVGSECLKFEFLGCQIPATVVISEDLNHPFIFQGSEIRRIEIKKDVTYLHPEALGESKTVKFYEGAFREIIVHSDNPAYYSIDGVLFTRDHTLLRFPPNKLADAMSSGTYTVPAGTKAIAPHAFAGAYGLFTVRVPCDVEISSKAFEDAIDLEHVVRIPGNHL